MTERPLVSIIIPYFRQEEFLLDAVRSAQGQTYENVEIVVVDDASPDATAQDLLGWRDIDNLEIVRHRENLGASAAKNTGVATARGAVIAILDADDLVAPSFVESGIGRLMDDESLSGVFTDVLMFGEIGAVPVNHRRSPHCSLPELLWHRDSPNTFLLRKEAYARTGVYKPHLRFGEDVDLWIRLLAAGHAFAHIAEPLYLYRKHDGAQTARQRFAVEMTRMLVTEHRRLCEENLEQMMIFKAREHAETMGEFRELHARFAGMQRKLVEQYSLLSSMHESVPAEVRLPQ